MGGLLILAILSTSVRVEVHLVEAEDLGLEQQGRLEEAISSAIVSQTAAPVGLGRRALPDRTRQSYEYLVVRPILGPRHLRLLAERWSSSAGTTQASIDIVDGAELTESALIPLVRALFPLSAPRLAVVGPPPPAVRIPVVLAGAAGVLAIAAAVTAAVGSTRHVGERPGFLDPSGWAEARAMPVASAVALGLTVGAGFVAGLAVVAAAAGS